MKRKLAKLGIFIGVVIVVLAVALLVFPGQMVKAAVNKAGPAVLGVDVRLEGADFKLLQGDAELKRLFIGNPKGYNTPSLVEVETITVKLDTSTLTKDTIIIEKVFVENPVFTYQKGLLGSNLSKLLKQLEGDKPDDGKDQKKDKEAGKKVIINELEIQGATVKLSVKGIPAGAPIPLPTITLKDIGKEKDGASIAEAVAAVFKAVLGSITKVVGAVLNVAAKGGEVAVDAVKITGGAAVGVTKAVGKGALGTTKAVGKGAITAVKGVTGIFSGDDEEEKTEEEKEEAGDQ